MTGPTHRLTEFELHLALAVAHPDVEPYGAALRRAIERRAGRPVSIGSVYATLARLERRGLVRHRVSEPEPVRGGRARKLYALTDSGRATLRATSRGLLRMMEGVPLVHGDPS